MAVKRYFPTTKMASPCPACGCTTGRETMVTGVHHCTECKGTVGQCYRGEALALVHFDAPLTDTRPCFACQVEVNWSDAICHECAGSGKKKIPQEDLRYFDFTFVDTNARIHGWFDRISLRVVQEG